MDLVEVGRAYLDAHSPPGFVASTTGGSVARGEADQYSDLDLNIFVDGAQNDHSANREFGGEIIQIHVHPLPSVTAVRQSAWGYRFLREAGIVRDPTGRYESFARQALAWLDSPAGLGATRAGALSDVAERRQWAERTIAQGDLLGAGMASIAAVTDAAMLHRFCMSGAVSTGIPISSVCESGSLPEVDVPWRHLGLDETEKLVQGLAAYRRHLAQASDQGEDFILDDVQDRMTTQKATRLVSRGDSVRLGETLYHETFWTVISRGVRPLEEHIGGLPSDIAAVLRRIGFDKPDPRTVLQRLTWADETCEAACSEP